VSGWLAGALARRTPTVGLLLALVAVGLVRLAVWLWRQPVALAGLAVAGVTVWRPATVAAVAAGLVLALVVGGSVWSWLWPDSWGLRVAGPVRSWRRRRFYEARWAEAVHGCGLVRGDVEPLLMSVRAGAGGVDRLHVHMAPGQIAADWRDAAPRVASALEVRSVRPRQAGPRDVLLLVRWREVRRRDPVWPDEIEAEIAEVVELEQAAAEPDGVLLPPPVKPRGAFPRRPR
jgi:hypothetical protein